LPQLNAIFWKGLVELKGEWLRSQVVHRPIPLVHVYQLGSKFKNKRSQKVQMLQECFVWHDYTSKWSRKRQR